MGYFVQATEHDTNMHAKIQDLTLYELLQLNTSRFDS
jgi:hypothetical protein